MISATCRVTVGEPGAGGGAVFARKNFGGGMIAARAEGLAGWCGVNEAQPARAVRRSGRAIGVAPVPWTV